MAMKVTALLTRLIVEIQKDAARPENRPIRDKLQGGVNALVMLKSLLESVFPDSELLPDSDDDPDKTMDAPSTK